MAATALVMSRGSLAPSRAVLAWYRVPVNASLRRALSTSMVLSTSQEPPKPPPKHTVLEQPTRFNPPSHGSRLPRKNLPKHYGPAFTSDEIKEQNNRDYPTMLPPEGTFAHWFWTSRAVHGWIAIGTLTILAVVSFAMNFSHTSPFKDMIPPSSSLLTQPITFITTWWDIIGFHYDHLSRESQASRFQRIDDAMKRKMYQRAHGIDQTSPITKYFGGGVDMPDSPELAAELEKARKMHEEREKANVKEALEAYGDYIPKPPRVLEEEARATAEKKAAEEAAQPRKKWFGL